MEIELLPSVTLLSNTFNVLVAPAEMLACGLNSHPELQRYQVLFVCGNYSRILSRLDRNFTKPDVRRAFTAFQLLTILKENHHSLMIVEHDPLFYEDASDMEEYLAIALRQTSRDATVLLFAPVIDRHLEKMTELADRVFCFYETQKTKSRKKAETETPGCQATLEAYS